MYSIIARGGDVEPGATTTGQYEKAIITAASNEGVFSKNNSDLHAEANAICSYAASRVGGGEGLAGATCYVTMPPCKNCFMLLTSAKIKKIVR